MQWLIGAVLSLFLLPGFLILVTLNAFGVWNDYAPAEGSLADGIVRSFILTVAFYVLIAIVFMVARQ